MSPGDRGHYFSPLCRARPVLPGTDWMVIAKCNYRHGWGWSFRRDDPELLQSHNGPNAETTLRDVSETARTHGLQIRIFNASKDREIDADFASLARERPVRKSGFVKVSALQNANYCAARGSSEPRLSDVVSARIRPTDDMVGSAWRNFPRYLFAALMTARIQRASRWTPKPYASRSASVQPSGFSASNCNTRRSSWVISQKSSARGSPMGGAWRWGAGCVASANAFLALLTSRE
jgi:hypothetical protein